ncbi:hypothetical protein TrispH2_004691 [Trichoplax sp. H2]|nr:hypothetical protein TrispH2_004691 [Trichoplax sp. H2]|eukprot:RDD44234.1 hypothetical protein TrispH2_004691 [Trichoplax sp. H2]
MSLKLFSNQSNSNRRNNSKSEPVQFDINTDLEYIKLPRIDKIKKKQSEIEKPPSTLGKKCREHSLRIRRMKEPLPMRQRALPQSFWQELETSETSRQPLPTSLPPLFVHDSYEDIASTRPVTPPGEKTLPRPAKFKKITHGDPHLLFRLFDGAQDQNKKSTPTTKRGRPSRKSRLMNAPDYEEDPYLSVNFPSLSLHESKKDLNPPALAIMKMDVNSFTTIDLPVLTENVNYSAILSDVVAKM